MAEAAGKADGVFYLVEDTKEQVIVGVRLLDTLDVARHPYLNKSMEYITVTKGDDHTLTVVNSDGKTWSIDFGLSGHTLVSENVARLRREVMGYLKRSGVNYGRYEW